MAGSAVGSAVGDDDWGSNASSDDEPMEDIDANEAEVDPEADCEDEEDEEIGDDEDPADEEELEDQSPLYTVRRSASKSNTTGDSSYQPPIVQTSPSPKSVQTLAKSSRKLYEARPEAVSASLYDIVPTIAAPQCTSINAIAATPDMRFWFSGGSDCYIRKYDGVATINGKTLLTVAQRHPFVDSVIKAGVLMNYWDNEEPDSKLSTDEASLSPVYSLAVHSEALWILSGLESGAINLYSVRHDEGNRIAFMHQHKSAVSVMKLAYDERSVLSGSWDKRILDWDLDNGQVKRSFEGSGGQISAIEIRPNSGIAISEEISEQLQNGEGFTSNNENPTYSNGLSNGMNDTDITKDAPGSQTDSLFGGSDNSLFIDTAGDNPTISELFRDEDDEIPIVPVAFMDNDETVGTQGDVLLEKEVDATSIPTADSVMVSHSPTVDQTSDYLMGMKEHLNSPYNQASSLKNDIETTDSVFLAASIDGTIRIWDRRQPNPVANIPTRTGVPPWCMDACWSPDGNFLYAGRRNGTVEEFSIHRGLKNPERTLKFPQGSGPVSALRTMPNGRHLICASHDILRLYDLKEPQAFKHSTVPFLIIPGPPRAGVTAALHIDPTCKYMISIAGNRGWDGSSTEVLIGYEIGTQP